MTKEELMDLLMQTRDAYQQAKEQQAQIRQVEKGHVALIAEMKDKEARLWNTWEALTQQLRDQIGGFQLDGVS